MWGRFVKADDDSYIVMDHLRSYLTRFNTSEPHYLGRRLFRIGDETFFHAGGPGAGQAVKICNNMMLAIAMLGVSEAFLLGKRLGLDYQKIFDVTSTSSGQSWALTTYCPVPGPVPTSPANNDYKPGFASNLMVKDLTLAQDAANAAELWNQARDKQAAIAHKVTLTKARIAAAQDAYAKIAGAIDTMARAAYANGGIDPSLQVLVSDNPATFLEQTAALARLPYIAVAELTGTAASGRILLAAPITQDEIEQRFADQIENVEEVTFDRGAMALRARRRRSLRLRH